MHVAAAAAAAGRVPSRLLGDLRDKESVRALLLLAGRLVGQAPEPQGTLSN